MGASPAFTARGSIRRARARRRSIRRARRWDTCSAMACGLGSHGTCTSRDVRIGMRDVLAAGEGLETMLSLKVALPTLPVVAALSATHLAALVLPPGLARLYIAVDADDAGKTAATALTTRAQAAGIEAIRVMPRREDFNEDLCAIRSHRASGASAAAARTGRCCAVPVRLRGTRRRALRSCSGVDRWVSSPSARAAPPAFFRGSIGAEPVRAGNGCGAAIFRRRGSSLTKATSKAPGFASRSKIAPPRPSSACAPAAADKPAKWYFAGWSRGGAGPVRLRSPSPGKAARGAGFARGDNPP